MKNKFCQASLMTFFLIYILEISLRMLGFTNYRVPDYSIYSAPPGAILPDGKYGFTLADGRFEVTINEGLHYVATHIDGKRVSRFKRKDEILFDKTINFYGDSFCYGMGLSDSMAVPFLVQMHLDSIDVHSYAVPGYGTIQCLMKLQETYRENQMPDIVILCHHPTHYERNDLAKSYQEKLTLGLEFNQKHKPGREEDFANMAFPYGQIDNGVFTIGLKPIQEFASIGLLRKHSALFNQLALGFQKKLSSETTLAIINEMNKLCVSKGAKFIVASLEKDDQVQAYCDREKISFWNVSVPIHKEGYNLLPYDSHPSSLAAKEYADLILCDLQKVLKSFD